MLILQAGWLEGRLHLWGEVAPYAHSSYRDSDHEVRTNDHISKYPISPFDAGPLLLSKVIATIADSDAAARVHHTRMAAAWLPSWEDHPIPAQPAFLASDRSLPDLDKVSVKLAPWRVTTLPLSWFELCATLSVCANGSYLGRRLRAGSSLLGWSNIWRYSGALVARQAFLPILEKADPGYESRWRPLLDREEQRRFNTLSKTLPPIAAALSYTAEMPEEVENPGKRYLLGRRYRDDCVDRLVRSGCSTQLTRAVALKGQHSGAHAAWLAALRTDGRKVRWDNDEELRELSDDLLRWRRPIVTGFTADLQLQFNLKEPRRRNGSWGLHIKVADIATGETVSLWKIKKAAARMREYALVALGQAQALSTCLQYLDPADSSDDRLTLDTSAAYMFLSQDVALLRAAGYTVITPKWWRDPTAENPVRLRVALAAAGTQAADFAKLGLDQLADVHWHLVLGGEEIDPDELKELVDAQESLVFWKGNWIALDRGSALAAIRELKEQEERPTTLRDLTRLSLGGNLGDGVRIEVAEMDQHGAMAQLIKRLQGDIKPENLAVPESFTGELRPYQHRGLSWLAWLRQWGLGGCLADDMGLGKTIQALALIQHAKDTGLKTPVLLVCPLSIIANWRHETERFTPNLTILTHYGSNRTPGRLFRKEALKHDLVITSYNLMCRDYAALSRIDWGMVVLDEAQNIKNPTTLQSRTARSLSADFRLALTGTPVENQVGDLWSIMDFLNPGLLGTRSQFSRRFQRPIRIGIGGEERSLLRQITSPFILRRLKSDPEIIADLPERVENKVFCNLTSEQARLYADELKRLDRGLVSSEGTARRGLVLATLTRLKQICNHPEHYLRALDSSEENDPKAAQLLKRSGKLQRMDVILNEIMASDESLLIFTQYAVMGKLLQVFLRDRFGCDVPFLYGKVSRQARNTMIQRFQAGHGPAVFILSLKAGGAGLNLTRANHVLHFDRWWNPAVENQATDRVHRIGQHRNVFVHKMICAGTLEARIDALIESKLSLANELIGSGESWLADLSNERLREVLQLSSDAVASDTDDEDWK